MERRQPDQAGFQGDGVRELQPRESAAGPGSREGRVSGIRESPVGHSDRSTAGIFAAAQANYVQMVDRNPTDLLSLLRDASKPLVY
ncbi:MAG TPA: hypothetical protein VF078_01620 [Nitrospira sp.]